VTACTTIVICEDKWCQTVEARSLLDRCLHEPLDFF